MVQDDLKKQGYDREEEYFYKLNQELLERKRQQRDAERAAQQARAHQSPHWMKCPKCGADMREIDVAGIKIDRCLKCGGTYLDKGEIETLLASREPHGFLEVVRKKLR